MKKYIVLVSLLVINGVIYAATLKRMGSSESIKSQVNHRMTPNPLSRVTSTTFIQVKSLVFDVRPTDDHYNKVIFHLGLSSYLRPSFSVSRQGGEKVFRTDDPDLYENWKDKFGLQ